MLNFLNVVYKYFFLIYFREKKKVFINGLDKIKGDKFKRGR